MYTFFDLGNAASARFAAGAGAMIVTAILMATAIIPASPATVQVIGAFA
ncbi:hypothetical protein [Erythrobacter sp. F6033]|nr:hypothetical protein [Erythrobacter sp. F6033]MCK0127824.1 hypothetical protein [Erythrobacter sp. F6033]